MKRILSAAFALLILASCNRPIPPQATPKVPEGISANITFYPGHLTADFPNGQACIYFKAGQGASVLLPQKGQFEIAGQFWVDLQGWACTDVKTGDYVIVRRNGSASGKVAGMSFHLMPAKNEI